MQPHPQNLKLGKQIGEGLVIASEPPGPIIMVGQLETMMSSQILVTNVACAIGPSVNPLQNRETQHVNIVLQHNMYQFFEQLELIGKPSNVITFSTDISSQNLVFWEIFGIFSSRNH